MGQKCAQCGKVWALRKADPDGVFRCMRHTQQPKSPKENGRKSEAEQAVERIDNREKLIGWLSKHAHAASAAHAAGIGKAIIAAIQMIDPMAPEQELGGFTIGRVSGQQPPSRTHPDPDPIQADAE